MKEQLISFLTSQLAKSKGFNEKCRFFYTKENGLHLHDNSEDLQAMENGSIDDE